MYCSNCGQKIEDHLGKNCLFSRESSFLLKSFMLTSFLTLSRFNRNLVTYPIQELYNSFASITNLPTVDEILKIYSGEEDWQYYIFLSIDNLPEDKIFNALIKGEFIDSSFEWFTYNDDSSFSNEVKTKNTMEQLTMEIFKAKNNKPFWEVFDGKS